jgi:glycosyltransferase involved in cell wall biosynthesis
MDRQLRLSVCISTHERPHLLQRALQGLVTQTRPADEIICTDSSRSTRCAETVAAATAASPGPAIRYLHSNSRALPWNRGQGSRAATGDVVLFLDDDVRLEPEALAALERAYLGVREGSGELPVGVGFLLTWDDGRQPQRHPREWRERWLGTARLASGTLTEGGLPVSSAGLRSPQPVQVSHFWGGAMSFRRDVLLRIGGLEWLVQLYEAGLGRAEDIVLSAMASEHGPLYLITEPLARHPLEVGASPTPYAASGWKLGMSQTWGRAHSLRWLARDPDAYRRTWLRVILLELARGAGGIARRPWRSACWARLAGAGWGICRTVTRWGEIPQEPGRQVAGRLWRSGGQPRSQASPAGGTGSSASNRQ